jgi:hypothetical protein
MHDIVYKYIGKVYKRYERNEKMCMHRISQMGKVIPSFQYEPLVLSPKLETSNEEKYKGNTNGAIPSSARTKEEEP